MIKTCDNCDNYRTYFDCSQCDELDEWTPNKPDTKQVSKYEKLAMLHALELDMYKIKNKKYGDSFGIGVKKYGLISALTRMSDKWNRIENLILTGDNGTGDESLRDSLMDLSNYCNMTIIELEDLCN